MLHEIQGSLVGPMSQRAATEYINRYGITYVGMDWRAAIRQESYIYHSRGEELFLSYYFDASSIGESPANLPHIVADFIAAFLFTFTQYKLYSVTWQSGLTAIASFVEKSTETPTTSLPPISDAEMTKIKDEVRTRLYNELRKELTSTVYDLLGDTV